MPRQCSVCGHRYRREIEVELALKTLKVVAKRFAVSTFALSRHSRLHPRHDDYTRMVALERLHLKMQAAPVEDDWRAEQARVEAHHAALACGVCGTSVTMWDLTISESREDVVLCQRCAEEEAQPHGNASEPRD